MWWSARIRQQTIGKYGTAPLFLSSPEGAQFDGLLRGERFAKRPEFGLISQAVEIGIVVELFARG